MGAEKDNIIVVLEFGTSSIRGIAGRKKPNGGIQILAIEQEKVTGSILRGVVYNIDKTVQAVTNITHRIGEKLNVNVHKAYVALAGQSLHGVNEKCPRDLETQVKITTEIVDNLLDLNRAKEYPNSEILEVVPQEYIVGNRTESDPVGIQAERIEGHFLNIVARNTLRENINKCMKLAGIEIADIVIAPIALAHALLTESEKRTGCAFVDFGAGTTTISMYSGTLLRFLVVLPLGGNTITNDIARSTQMDPEEAEEIKRKYGVAFMPNDIENPRSISFSGGRTIDETKLNKIIEARQEEIILNVDNQMKKQLENHNKEFLPNIIITGGAAQMKHLVAAITQHTKNEKVKIAKSLITQCEVSAGIVAPTGNSIDTLIAILMNADIPCTAEIISEPIPPVVEPEPIPEETCETEATKQEPKESEKQDEPKTPKGPSRLKKIGTWFVNILTENPNDEE